MTSWYDERMKRKRRAEDAHVLRPPTESLPADSKDPDALIQWMLGLPAIERLAVAQGFVDSVIALDGTRTD